MPNRLFQLLALAIVLSASGAALVVVSNEFSVIPETAIQQTSAPSGIATSTEAPVLLPTIRVQPELDITTLAPVYVRPAASRRVADLAPVIRSTHATKTFDSRQPVATGTPQSRGGFDMPYYSFGRASRRANKE